MTDTPPQSRSGVPKYLLGCALVAFLLVAGGGYWLYKTAQNAIITDPVKANAMLQEFAPGARLPEGYTVTGLDLFGHRVVTCVPTGSEDPDTSPKPAILISLQPADAKVKPDAFGEEGVGREDLGEETLAVAGREVTFQKSKAKRKNGEEMLLQYAGVLPRHDGSQLVLIFLGREDHFDRGPMDAFLQSLPGEPGQGEPAKDEAPKKDGGK